MPARGPDQGAHVPVHCVRAVLHAVVPRHVWRAAACDWQYAFWHAVSVGAQGAGPPSTAFCESSMHFVYAGYSTGQQLATASLMHVVQVGYVV